MTLWAAKSDAEVTGAAKSDTEVTDAQRAGTAVGVQVHGTPGALTEVVGACALDCPDACSWVVTVEGGRAIRLRGNETHPFTRGGLCAKVNPYIDYAGDSRRLLHPLRRVGPKGVSGPQVWERISWEEALEEIARRFTQIVESHGGEALWPFAGTGSVGWLQGCGPSSVRLFNALGASQHDLDICSRSGTLGMRYTAGTAMGLDPSLLAESEQIVLWGTNTLTTNLHLWPFITQGRHKGAPLVVIDPVRTRTAAQADRHLAPRPGTDGALALGVMAQLVATGAQDDAYLARATLGWDRFRDEVLAGWSAERAATVCGLETAEVTWLAEQFATRRPTGIRSLMGVQRHAGGGQAVRLISCIPALTGDYARAGGGMCYSTSSAYPFDEEALARPDLRPAGEPRKLSMSRLGQELLGRTEPPVQGLMIWGANPVISNPDQRTTRAGLLREDLFTVVVEHVLTDTCDYADLVLPGTTQLEHVELVESYSHLYVGWNAPAVSAPGECRSHTEIFRCLARAMGRTEPELQADDETLATAALSSEHPALQGITVDSLKARGWQRLNYPDPWVPFAEGFATPSGRFEFTSAVALRDGLSEMPQFIAPRETLPAEDGEALGLSLVSAANHYLISSTFAGSPKHRKAGEAVVDLHPQDAADRGIADGEPIRVGNARGQFTAVARLTERVRRGVAATSKGLLPTEPQGSTVNATVSGGESDMGGGALFHDNRVEIRLVVVGSSEREL